jgi:hypothetical protein
MVASLRQSKGKYKRQQQTKQAKGMTNRNTSNSTNNYREEGAKALSSMMRILAKDGKFIINADKVEVRIVVADKFYFADTTNTTK